MAFGNVNIGGNETINTASETAAGIAKLYGAAGNNTDGAMTQKAASEAFVEKENIKQVSIVEIPSIDETPLSGSTNLVTSGGVYDALQSAGGGMLAYVTGNTLLLGLGGKLDATVEGNTLIFTNN